MLNTIRKSPMYDKILYWYINGYWTKEMIHQAVIKGLIIEEEYKTIIGEN